MITEEFRKPVVEKVVEKPILETEILGTQKVEVAQAAPTRSTQKVVTQTTTQ